MHSHFPATDLIGHPSYVMLMQYGVMTLSADAVEDDETIIIVFLRTIEESHPHHHSHQNVVTAAGSRRPRKKIVAALRGSGIIATIVSFDASPWPLLEDVACCLLLVDGSCWEPPMEGVLAGTLAGRFFAPWEVLGPWAHGSFFGVR